MSEATIAAIINGVIALAVLIIGIWLGKSREEILADKLQVYHQQLQYVYEPLHELFMFPYTPEQATQTLDGIMQSCLSMVPPAIEQKYVAIKKKKPKDVKLDDFTTIYKVVESDYNWIRRKLGLPYEKSKINWLNCSYGLTSLAIKEFAFYALYALIGVIVLNIVGLIASPYHSFSIYNPFTFVPLLAFAGYLLGVVNVRIRY